MRTAFSYSIPDHLEELARPGTRVLVPFGRRTRIGVILEVPSPPSAPSAPGELKPIAEILDPLPALSSELLRLGRWLADYYLAPVGETFRVMLPPAADLRRARHLRITESGKQRLEAFAARDPQGEKESAEAAVLRFCAEGIGIGPHKLGKIPGGSAAAARLLRRGELTAADVNRRRRRRMQTVAAWITGQGEPNPAPETPAAQAQLRVRSLLLEHGPMPVSELARRAGVSRSRIERMAKGGALQLWDEPVQAEGSGFEAGFTAPSNVLNAEQQSASRQISRWLDEAAFTAALIYGVTGSGKTEVYLQGIAAALERGRAAIVLVPEIALTLWLARLCRARFGDTVAVLHSALGDPERAGQWWRVRRGQARVVVGTRSAVFAPAEKLGLIIVDEEHDTSYKQEETPRYNGRDVAVMRAKLENAVALLGSATPSLESFHHARQGKYKLLCLSSRVENRPLARVRIIDLRQQFRTTQRSSPVSEPLRAALAERLAAGTQSLVLVNRRGYSWFALCRSCGASITCQNCSISLTYHRRRQRLACHYCGFSRTPPQRCPKCDSEYLYYVGAGSEQIEQQLRALFPQARIARLDRDTARTKRAFEHLLGNFAAGKFDILVGTQMLAKGHDFHRVTLAGVLSADAQLGFPDFRAAERTFQLLTQVSGRAGRGELAGEVLVETHYPEHYAIQLAAAQDYPAFFERELHFRRLMHYPPFTALAGVLVRSTKLEEAIGWSRRLETYFEKAGSPDGAPGQVRVLGPAAAPLARLKREHRFQFLLKSPRRAALHQILAGVFDFCAQEKIPERALSVDVDPVNLM